MAVEKLNLITITGHKNEYDSTLIKCMDEPLFHVENAFDIIKTKEGILSLNETNPYTGLITQVTNLATGANISLHYSVELDNGLDRLPIVSFSNLSDEISSLQSKYNQMILLRDEIKNTIHDNERIVEQLHHMGNTNANLDKIFSFEFFKFRFGYMPRESYDSLNLFTNDIDDMFFFASSIEKQEVWGVYFTPRTKSQRIDTLFSSLHFERVRISDKAHGTPIEARLRLLDEIENAKGLLLEKQGEIDDFIKNLTPTLVTYSSQLQYCNKIFELRKKVIFTESGFSITGWVPVKYLDKFTDNFKSLKTVSYIIEKPTSKDKVQPPTKLRNNMIVKPFEEFVNMYGLPSYNEIDPTPFVAISYILFFGMMFGDVGQGAVLVGIGLLLWFIKKINLGKIISMVGCSSVAFGFIYGSIFGNEDILSGFKPMENINTVLILAVSVGAVMITIAMILNIINALRQKDSAKLILSQNGISGLVFYWGVIVLALGMFNFIKTNIPVALIISLVVIAISAMFLRQPLSMILERKKDWMPQNKVEFLLENFFEMFEVVLSFLTNTISFIRIGAFALNHVGMMTVVSLLAQTADGSQNIAVLIIGNIFVVGFEGMIVCIQALRLEFYELFGRFFEGDGRPFESAGNVEINK